MESYFDFHFHFHYLKIEELRMSVSRAEQQLAWKEDRMNQEIANIQTVCKNCQWRDLKVVCCAIEVTRS